jgi:hypothetical protein
MAAARQVGSSSPQHWDRAINDFKLQLDQFDKDGKALLGAVSYIYIQYNSSSSTPVTLFMLLSLTVFTLLLSLTGVMLGV